MKNKILNYETVVDINMLNHKEQKLLNEWELDKHYIRFYEITVNNTTKYKLCTGNYEDKYLDSYVYAKEQYDYYIENSKYLAYLVDEKVDVPQEHICNQYNKQLKIDNSSKVLIDFHDHQEIYYDSDFHTTTVWNNLQVL